MTETLTPVDHDAQAARVARWGAFHHARNVVMQLRSWWVSLFAIGALEPLLTVLALGVGLGVVVDAASPGALGVPFLQFVAPAMLLSTAVHGAQIENTIGVFSSFKWHELYQAAASTPTTPSQLAEGHWLGSTVRYLINCTTVIVVLLVFGAITPVSVLILFPVAVLTAWAFGNPVMAWTALQCDEKGQFSILSRLVVLPLTLFSGTYFPLDVLPGWLHPIGWVSPLWHGVNLTRILTLGQAAPAWLPFVHVAYLTALSVAGLVIARRIFHLRLTGVLPRPRQKQVRQRVASEPVAVPPGDLPDGQSLLAGTHHSASFSGRFPVVAARGLKANWGTSSLLMASGAVEPVLYLLAMGIGLGTFIGQVQAGTSYAAWIAPALLATSALNGAVMDATWNVFMKLKFDKLYETMLSTSLGPLDVALGEITVALVRGGIYATSFVAVMALLGLVGSWWVLLTIPACLLIALGIAALGIAATSLCRTFQQMDWIMLALMPMFMFSGTFYPVDVYPAPIAAAVKCLPLWHGIEMLRDLNAGAVSWLTAGHALYFVVLAMLGVWVASLRLKALFLR